MRLACELCGGWKTFDLTFHHDFLTLLTQELHGPLGKPFVLESFGQHFSYGRARLKLRRSGLRYTLGRHWEWWYVVFLTED